MISPSDRCCVCKVEDSPLNLLREDYISGVKRWNGRHYVEPMIRRVRCEIHSGRGPLEDCTVVETPLGLGVAVGNIVWTNLGPGVFAGGDPRVHQEALDALKATVKSGEVICMGSFALLSSRELTGTLYSK